MRTAYISLGSNHGTSLEILAGAARMLDDLPFSRLAEVSSYYRTEPQDRTDQPWFLNQAAALETSLPPGELLARLQDIENRHGRNREREGRFGPRTLDLDILLFGDAVIAEPELIIPHPRLETRAFALIPLLELNPDLRLPSGKKLEECLQNLQYRLHNDLIFQKA